MNVSQNNVEPAASLFQKGQQEAEKGLVDQAVESYMAAAKLRVKDIFCLLDVGTALEQIKRFGKAYDVYLMVLEVDPDNLFAHASMGELMLTIEKFPLAVLHLEKADTLKPDDCHILTYLGRAYRNNGDSEKAEKTLLRAKELDGDQNVIYGALTEMYEKNNQLDKFENLLEEALETIPDDENLRIMSAILDRRKGNFKAALTKLNQLESQEESLTYHGRICFEKARAFDSLGEYDNAFTYFSKGNAFQATQPLNKNVSKEMGLELISKFRDLSFDNWSEQTASVLEGKDSNPIFLVGFPRSGTTLLNQILDSHHQLEALEEKPIIAQVRGRIVSRFGKFPACLNDIDSASFGELRDDYLRFAGYYSTGNKDVYLVDKNPLNIIEIPLLLKLFPKAKIILTLRHPCDCTLSCFMQHFLLNNGMLNLMNLDDATNYYQEVFGNWMFYVEKLTIDYYPIYYEKLVEDFEHEARNLISFLDLKWDSNVLNYIKTAKEKGRINTPSYHQVIKPIYQDSKNRWRRYEKHFEPYLDRLKPFCEAFGYEL